MDASLQGLLEYGKRRRLTGIIESDNGYSLSDAEARKYIKWALMNGYKYLSEVPDYEQVKDKI